MEGSSIQQIKDRLDIVEVIGSYLKLQKAGANYRAPCPFHSEKTPSFFVSPVRQIWHCFGSCSEGGDMFKFVMKIEGLEFGDALRLLAQKAGVELKPVSPKLKSERQRLYEICELACQFFEKQLEESSLGREARKYLLGRGIKEESIKKWRLGYSPDVWQGLSDFLVGRGYKREEVCMAGLAVRKEQGNFYDRFRGRIMFSIFDPNSQIIGFGGRVFAKARNQKPETRNEQVAKYVNTPNTLLYDKSRILYGLDKAKMAIRRKDSCILVEGYTDVIMLSQAGFENVAATSGTALTVHQLQLLKRYTINLFTAFDMDVAGDSATKRGIDLAQSRGFNIKVVSMPEGLDPADIAAQDLNQWREGLDKAKSIMEFYFESAFSQFGAETPEAKKEIGRVLLPVIKRVPNKIEQSHWLQELAGRLGVREEDVMEELNKLKPMIGTMPRMSRSYGGAAAANVSEKQKSRKDLLEERLACLIVSSPGNLDLIAENDLRLFSQKISRLIEHFRQKSGKEEKQENNLPPELAEFINELGLKSEAFGQDEDTGAEFGQCLKEIRFLEFKKELDCFSREIKKAEAQRDSAKVQEFTKRYKEALDKGVWFP